MRNSTIGTFCAGWLTLFGLAGQAAADDSLVYKFVHCDVEYVIQPGDTLRSISEAAYGRPHSQLIFSRNAGVINLGQPLPVGVSIIVPCKADDAVFYPDEEALVIELDDEDSPVADAPVVAFIPDRSAKVRILTSEIAPPFVDTSPQGEGLTAKIINSAHFASRGPDDLNAQITYVNDRSSHLVHLLEQGSFAIGFPWVKPPCADSQLANSMPFEAWMCGAFEFSAPIYEYFQSVMFSVDRPLVLTTLADLRGKRICLLDREPKTQLTYAGVTVENSDFTISPEAENCLALLRDGEVDVAILDPLYLPRDDTEDFREAVELTYLVTLHAVAPLSKPDAVLELAKLNSGLQAIRESGAWFDIVTPYLIR